MKKCSQGFLKPRGLKPRSTFPFINPRVFMFTWTTSALPAPVEANMAQRAALITGYVRVTLHGGGLGESSIGATIKDSSC